MSKRKEQKNVEILDVVPERTIEWEKDSEKELAVLLVPRFRKGILKKWLQPKLKKPFMRVTLDEIGSFVWMNCDGQNTVRDICNKMKDHFGDKVDPVEARVNLFFGTLFRSDFVRYWQKNNISETQPAS